MKRLFYRYSKFISIAVSICLIAGGLSSYTLKSAAATETKSDSASQIRMAQIEGDVEVVDSVGKELTTTENMRLFTGNRIITKEESYAFFNLDDEKAVKLDSVSDAEIRESGNKMEILLKNGALLLDVKKPVASNSSVHVRSSSMVMGIRGTYVFAKQISPKRYEFGCVEGISKVVITDLLTKKNYELEIQGGEKITVQDGDASGAKKEFMSVEDVPAFILMAFAQNPEDAKRIKDAGGMDFTGVTLDFARSKLTQENKDKSDRMNTYFKNKAIQQSNEKQNNVWGRGTGNRQQGGTRGRTNNRTQGNQNQNNNNNNSSNNGSSGASTGGSNNNSGGSGSSSEGDNNNEETKYSINITSSKGGTVKADKKSAAENEEVTLTVEPKEGYELKSISAKTDEGEAVTLSEGKDKNTYTFKMVPHSIEVEATFNEVEYSITVKNGDGGEVKANKKKATKGTEITLTVSPDKGYELDSLTAESDDGDEVKVSGSGSSYSFKMVADDVTVEATFKKTEEEKKEYTITVNSGEGGTVTASASKATEGTAITLTAAPSEGYELDSLTAKTDGGNSVELSGSGNSYSFNMVADNVTIDATFKETQAEEEKKEYTITVNSGEGGTVTASASKATEGTAITLTVAPSEGYELDSLTAKTDGGNSVDLSGSGTSYSFNMPADNVTVEATFKETQAEETEYSVTVNSGEGGTVTASPSSATEGTTITLTVTPDEGYELESISATAGGNEVELSESDGNYTFVMGTSDVTVNATFVETEVPINTYNITWSVSDGNKGSFSEDRPTSAEEGSIVNFDYLLERGYSGTVTVNGTAVDGKSFTMPSENTTVTLTITALPAYHITFGQIRAAEEGYFSSFTFTDVNEVLSFTYNGLSGNSKTDLYEGDSIVISTAASISNDYGNEEESDYVAGYVFSTFKQDTTNIDASFTMGSSDMEITAEYVREFPIYDRTEMCELSAERAKAGTTITLTFYDEIPENESVVINYYTDADFADATQGGTDISGTIVAEKTGDNTYTFVMPTSPAEITLKGN